MGSISMHLCISENIKKEFGLTNRFMYGSILPDILKKRSKNGEASHFIQKVMIKDEIRKLPNIQEAEEGLIGYSREIKLGYIAHLIEDYIWFNEFIPAYAKEKEKEVIFVKDKTKHTETEFSKLMYEDYSIVNKYLKGKYNIDMTGVKRYFRGKLSKDEYKAFCKDTACKKEGNFETVTFLTKEGLDKYIDKATNEVRKYIKKVI